MAMKRLGKPRCCPEPFQPYGDTYTGEIEVTSGYILQKPLEPNEKKSSNQQC